MALQVEATNIYFWLFSSFAFEQDQCHYWLHETIPGPYSGCTGSPTLPEWHVNTCPKVCCVSHKSFKRMKEIPGDGQLLLESWTGPSEVPNQSAGPAPLCKEEQDEY
ncbi:hypothetical protein AMECASPLE_029418 [Ameca splendens]|uniref:Uncharacterized protein n=1 Tax=Ameca splendens TaxID=208324 RepID=A0ABV1ADG5_9TELE